ncbi:TadE/TadG family type IV pilus assembly protein [Sphingomonas endophytica]|uniref:TadE-like domain-containing protein n=1 Tax=Sphingomonas endophytica TaxID=869719 RepID=A0A147HWE2_9SPHN|nr:TadE/TadG family type IV pilus assembly protein [Sphingomonas endophytica]KTT69203.1 hypothetical protein NS334_15280 [Sphingomonas endophytica]
MTRLGARLRADRRGAAAVEFAIVALPAITIMCALVDLGYRQYVIQQVQDGLDRAARRVTVGTSTTTQQLTTMLKDNVAPIAPKATVFVVPSSYGKFRQVARPEPITTDTAPLGRYNPGDCFTDINGNGVWDADAARAGTGGSDDIVVYVATVTFPEILPMSRLLGWDGVSRITASTMLKNQPYAAQPEPATVCG